MSPGTPTLALDSRAGVMLPAALSLIAGVTDVTSWLLLGGFFSAHVTGNLVVIAADVVTGKVPNLAAVLAIPAFIVTTAGATLIAQQIAKRALPSEGEQSAAVQTTTRILLGSQALLLIAAAGLSFLTRASTDPQRPLAVIIGLCAVCAMAAQNAYLHLLSAKAASTAVMTGNLVTATVAAIEILLSGGRSSAARAKWQQTWPLLAGFIAGCLVGAASASLFSDRAAIIPAALATVLFVIVLTRADTAAATSERSSQ